MPRSKTTRNTSKKSPKTPKLRRHASDQGYVVFNGGKPIYLGKYDLESTQEAYHRLIAEWKANGCKPPAAPPDLTVLELVDRFWVHAETYYVDRRGKQTTSLDNYRAALRPVVELYGSTFVTDFGPIALKAIRQTMIEQGWSRTHINKQVRLIKGVFDWGVGEQLYPSSVAEALKYVKGLRKGRSPARETERVKPAPDHFIEAIQPYVSRQVWAMVKIMQLSGPRPDEVTRLRPIDLDMSGEVWVATLDQHKTEYLAPDYTDASKTILLGPQVQELVRPFLADRPVDAYLFSAEEAEAERRAEQHRRRKTPKSCGNRPGTNKADQPRRPAGECYTVGALRRAVYRACEQAFPPPEHLQRKLVEGRKGSKSKRKETDAEYRERLGEKKWDELKTWIGEHRFNPRQLRHNAGTELRKKFGLEVAQTVLGHAMGSQITAQVYAEAAMSKALKAMVEVG